MALRVWLPLNGNLNNQGLSGDATINGSPSYTSGGKIADKYLNTGNMISIHAPTIKGSKICSFSFWAYVVSSTITSDWTLIARIDDQGTNAGSNMRFEVCPKSNYNGIYCFSNHNNGNYGLTNGCITSPVGGYYDQWVHFCFTSDGTTFTRYMNGVKIGTCAYNGEATFDGDFRLANNNKCYKQDVRIYDHCLSPKEVKEISKGLILHYKLDANNLNNLNLFTRELSIISTKNNYSIIGGLNSIPAATILANKGKTLTLSYNVSSIGDFVSTSNGWQKDRFGIHGSCNYTLNGGSAIQDYPLANLLSRGKISGRYYTTWTIPSNLSSVNSDLSFAIQTNPADGFSKPASTNDEIWFLNNVKLEWGSIPTLYDGPGAEDYSGYQNNGTIVGNIIATNDTPRYNSSSKFDTNAYIVREDHNLLNLVNGSNASITISVWAKNSSSSPNSLLFGYGSAAAQNKFLLCHLYNSGAVGLCYYSNDLWSSITNFDINKWYHICYVISGMTRKIYVNGELNAQGTVTSTLSIDAATAKLMIGKDIFRNNYNSSGISDVRVYATALSDNDIKELYEVGGAIDSNYNSYAYEFIEE